ncbi:bifunctional RNase H/acid phosphatase [Actinoplanes sp. NBRC 103695]|uniref:bifunctional RNase H/acid phosphatase n=1 Tax=Actinoplanes sp. NBRC 103695 TaxID=3032202 RepID=UPI00249F9F0D|nr:bifunctional RNase H/acid phosphatase [Actinoplanes sp. NBRC 103695]GLY97665.1 bifunctional RNase H/acid phosphatase [Actinoplanes sp. NBRC 103695]
MSTNLHVVVEADGGSRGNPGPAGYGAVVRAADTGEVLLERYSSLGVATNNVAEYSGLIAGLAAAAELNASRVDVRMDSKLVVEQMAGRWQIKNPGLRPLAAEAVQLAGRFAEVTYDWIPRERNRAADALANRAMDEAAGKKVPDVLPPPREERPLQKETKRSWAPPASTEEATRLILVRHGETAYTKEGRYSGRGDIPLSDEGEAQAMAAAGRVAGLARDVAAVVTSPLMRCVRTAEIIAAEAGSVDVTVLDDLIECDFGAWEGLTFAEVRQRWPGEMDAWLDSPAVAPPGGESFETVAVRARRALGAVLAAYPGGNVVLVSHVSPLKLILRDALYAGDGFLHRLFLDAAGVSTVDVWPDGNVAVRSVNETAHLR